MSEPNDSSNLWMYWICLGYVFGWFTLTTTGQDISRKTGEAVRAKTPKGSEWKLDWDPLGWLRVEDEEEERPRRAEVSLDAETVGQMALTQFRKEAMSCIKGTSGEIAGKFGTYWAEDPKDVMGIVGKACFYDNQKMRYKPATTSREYGWRVTEMKQGAIYDAPEAVEVKLFNGGINKKTVRTTLKEILDFQAGLSFDVKMEEVR